VTHDYDDWFEENAPCSRGSSPKSFSHSSTGSSVERRSAMVRLTPTLILILLLAAVFGFASGCSSRTVFVPEESPMRVGPAANFRVYHRVNGEWVLSGNKIEIPEGWYLVPPSFVKE